MLVKKLFCSAMLLASILGLTTSVSFAENLETDSVCYNPDYLDSQVNMWIQAHKKFEIIDIKYGEQYQDKNQKLRCAFILYKRHHY